MAEGSLRGTWEAFATKNTERSRVCRGISDRSYMRDMKKACVSLSSFPNGEREIPPQKNSYNSVNLENLAIP
jgi:hypothetical protein